jgi:uroporphyrinogen decarboxylase
VSAWGHTFLEEWDSQRLALATTVSAHRFTWDFIKLQPRASCFAEAFGSEYRASGNDRQAPVLVKQAVSRPEDWERVVVEEPRKEPLDDQVEALAGVVARVGPRVPVLQTVFSPLTVAGYLVGKDQSRVMRELTEDSGNFRSAMSRIEETLASFIESSVQAGAAGVFYAISGYASKRTVERSLYDEAVLPYDLRVLEALSTQAWFNVLHLCGPEIHFHLAEELPVQAVSWSIHDEGNPNLRQGRDASGKAVMGGIDQRTTLLTGSPEDVRREADEAMSGTERTGLLLAPGCSVPPEVSEENLQALSHSVRS